MPLFDLTPEMEFFLPFIFIFAIVFGSLQLVNVFKNKAVNAIIALALAFFTTLAPGFSSLLLSQFGNIATFFIVVFFISFILKIFGFKRSQSPEDYQEALAIQGVILFILLSVSYLFVDQIPTLPIIGTGQNLLLTVAVIFILAIFWAAFKMGTFGAVPQPKEAKG